MSFFIMRSTIESYFFTSWYTAGKKQMYHWPPGDIDVKGTNLTFGFDS